MPHWIRPIPVGYSEAAIRFRVSGYAQPMYNTIGLHFTALPTTADANAVYNAYTARMASVLTVLVTVEGVHILTQETATLQRVTDSTASAVVGTRAAVGGILPCNTAALVRKQSAFAGRAQRGRWYIPGLAEADVGNDGVLIGAYMTAMNTALDNLYADWTVYRPCIIHSGECTAGVAGHSGAHNVVPPEPTDLAGFDLDDHVATQRRRLVR